MRAALALPASLALLAACDRAPPSALVSAPPDIAMQAVTLRRYRESELVMTATSPALTLSRGTGALEATDAGVQLHEVGVSLQAPRLSGDVFEGVLHGEGGVTFQGKNGLTGEAPRLTFARKEGAQGVVAGDAGLAARRGNLSLEAQGYRYDLGEDRAEFEHVTTSTTGTTAP